MKQFEQVLKYQPVNSDALYWSAAVHRRAGNQDMAKSELVKAIELDPRWSSLRNQPEDEKLMEINSGK